MRSKIRFFNGSGQLDPKWTRRAQEISDWAQGELGLSYGDIDFRIAPNFDELSQVIATGGWPSSIQGWRAAQEYKLQKLGHELFNWRIYEIVVPSEPIIAHVFGGNKEADIDLVIAHVYGHSHMFHNNVLNSFYTTSQEKALPQIAGLEDDRKILTLRHGDEAVSRALEVTEPLSYLVDRFVSSGEILPPTPLEAAREEKLKVTDADANPARARSVNVRPEREKSKTMTLPSADTYDVAGVVMDIPENELSPEVRFGAKVARFGGYLNRALPLTKIAHEGFSASVDTMYALKGPNVSDGEAVQMLAHRSRGLQMSRLDVNPYGLGHKMLFSVFDSADGDFGTKWGALKRTAEMSSDYTLIAEKFTRDVFAGSGLYVFNRDEDTGAVILDSRDFEDVRNALLLRSSNGGLPRIYVPKGGVRSKSTGAFVLSHDTSRAEAIYTETPDKGKRYLQGPFTVEPVYAMTVINSLKEALKRPVYLETVDWEGERILMTTSKEGQLKLIGKG